MNDIYDIYVAGRGSVALAVAVRLGLFGLLDQAPADRAAIAHKLEISDRGARSLLRALRGLKLIERIDDKYQLAPQAAASLVPGRPGYLGGLMELEFQNYLSPQALLDAVRTGRQQVYDGAEPWAQHEQDPNRAAQFTAAMHSISEGPARALAEAFDFSSVKTLLDIGGGSGVYIIAALQQHADLKGIVLDIAPVCDLAKARFENAGLAARTSMRVANMFTESYGDDADAILFSQIMHDWDFSQCQHLLNKAYEALPEDGVVLLHEKLVEDDGGPLANALVDLDMLFWTEGQQLTQQEAFAMLSKAGFRDAHCQKTVGYWSLITARK